MCTVCISETNTCAVHRTAAYDRWDAAFGDDIRDLRDDIAAGVVDFADLEMAS